MSVIKDMRDLLEEMILPEFKTVKGKVDRIEKGLKCADEKLEKITEHNNKIDGRLVKVETKVDGIEKRLDRTDGKLDETNKKLDDIKSMFQKHDTETKERLAKVETKVENIETKSGSSSIRTPTHYPLKEDS